MCATAANLIERVRPPSTPLRQWLLTFPFPWKPRLAQDGELLGRLTQFVRKYIYGGGGLQDLTDSAGDFVLVAVDAGTYGATAAVLGGPSPENLSSETERNAQLTMSAPDGNFVFFPGPPKVLEFYRVFTNTGGNLNAIRFKVANLTGVNNTIAGQADLRPTASGPVTPTVTTYSGLTVEGAPTMTYPLVTPSAPPGTAPNAGLNSTLRLSFVGPQLNTQSVAVNFRVEYINSGAFFYWLVPQGK